MVRRVARVSMAMAIVVVGVLLGARPSGGQPLPVPLPLPVGPQQDATPPPSLSVSPATAAAGDVVTVAGQAHPALCNTPEVLSIAIRWDASQVLATTVADASGAFTTALALPADATPGAHSISSACALVAVPLGDLALHDVTVSEPAPTPPTTPPTTPVTTPVTIPPTPPPVEPIEPVVEPATNPEIVTADPAAPSRRPAAPASRPTAPVAATGSGAATPPSAPAPAATPVTPAATTSPPLGGQASGTRAAGLAGDQHSRSGVAAAMTGPGDIATDLGTIGSNLLLVLLFLVLVGLPAELVNESIEEHATPNDRPKSRMRQVLAWAERPVHGMAGFSLFAGFAVAAAAVTGFLDPDFGLDRASVAQTIGFATAFVLITLAWELPGLAYLRRRSGEIRVLEILPLALLIAGISVAFSRIVDLHPGYAFGVLAACPRRRGHADPETAGRAVAIDAAAVLGVALGAWLAWGAVDSSVEGSTDPSFGLLVVDSLLVATVLAGISCLTFSLVPVRFLKGEELLRWSKPAWIGFLAAGAFGLVHLVAHPQGGFATLASPTPTQLLPFVFVAGAALAYWLHVRRLDRREEQLVVEAESATIAQSAVAPAPVALAAAEARPPVAGLRLATPRRRPRDPEAARRADADLAATRKRRRLRRRTPHR